MSTTSGLPATSFYERLEEYKNNGYIALRGLFDQERVAECQMEAQRLLGCDWVSKDNLRTPFRFNSGDAPERIDPVIDVSPLFHALVEAPEIREVVAALLRDRPVLFKDKLIFKAPGTDGYTPHQDQAWWHLCPPDDILSVSIQIDGASKTNGCIEFLPGCHDRLITPEKEFRNLSQAETEQLEKRAQWIPIETEPGDVLIFHSLAPHRSGRNVAAVSRRSVYLTFSAEKHGDIYARNLEESTARALEKGQGTFFR